MPAQLTVALSGFALGASLIIAIGAQNAFVLRQGLRRERVLAVVAVCVACDWALITLGALGFGSLVRALPGGHRASPRGVAPRILAVHGALAVRSAIRGRDAGRRRRCAPVADRRWCCLGHVGGQPAQPARLPRHRRADRQPRRAVRRCVAHLVRAWGGGGVARVVLVAGLRCAAARAAVPQRRLRGACSTW